MNIQNITINKEYPTEEILLPSRNIFYDHDILKIDEKVKIRGLTVEEQKRLLQSNQENQEGILNDIVYNSIVYPNNMKNTDMFIIDRDYILQKVRQLTYGDEVKQNFACMQCGQQNETVINIDELDVKYFDDDFKLPIVIKTDQILMDNKPVTLSFTLPTINANKDNQTLLRYHKKEKNQKSLIIYTTVFSCLIQINGEELTVRDKDQIMNLYMQLPQNKISELFKQLNTDYGMENTKQVTCDNCGYTNEVSVMTQDFFLHF